MKILFFIFSNFTLIYAQCDLQDLRIALQVNQVANIEECVNKGTIDLKLFGDSLAQLAIRHQRYELLWFLLKKGIDRKPLVSADNIEVYVISNFITNDHLLDYLIAKDSINAQTKNGYTALIAAAALDDQSAAKKLLYKNANVNLADKDGITALHYAVALPNATIAYWLLAHQANLFANDKDSNTVLHYAIPFQNIKLIKRLLKLGADPKAPNKYQQTCLDLAQTLDNKRLVKLLSKNFKKP